jgi:hypothetical protein
VSVWFMRSSYNEGFSWEESVVVRSWESSVEEEFIWINCQVMGGVLEMEV